MKIEFPVGAAYDSNATSISFPVVVDGLPGRCLVSDEALMDNFGASDITPMVLLDAYGRNTATIQAAAKKRILAGTPIPFLLKSGDF